ncbi:DUF47 family protein [Candidatus Gottesmanbacteria bacterium]|nr:DUF47 family protein [Candidatus Gottesmanbacteria bacterium]
MNLFPKTPQFFAMFEELADTVSEAGTQLKTMQVRTKHAAQTAQKIRKLELRADAICHKLATEAQRTFITPIDREDIHELARNLDEVIDQIEEVASKIVLYNGMAKDNGKLKEFAEIISQTTVHIQKLIATLKYREKHAGNMKQYIRDIHTKENEGDTLIRHAIKELFSRQKNAITLIKWKDLYETMERVLDESEHVADIVEVIIVKNF